MRLVLFDIDGTLLSGHGVGTRAMEHAGRATLGPTFSVRGVDFSGALDPWIFAEAARQHGFGDVEAFQEKFREAYLERLVVELEHAVPPPSILPGVHALLESLRQRSDVVLGLVTGNYGRAAALKLRAVGIDTEQFVLGAYGDDAPTRGALVRLALDRWQALDAVVNPERVIVVGDTPRDIDCARQNGCRAFAVGTGTYPLEKLLGYAPDVAAADLTNPALLLGLLDED